MENAYDLIVIGTGAGGSAAAVKCRKAGWRVAVVDVRPYGGTCALRGCDPKKVLVGAAELKDWAGRMTGHGVTSKLAIDWPALMAFKRTFTDPVPEQKERGLEQQGTRTYHGRARFLGEETLQAADEVLRAERILLANGAKPAPLPIDGAEHLITSTEFLDLDALPEQIIFVGGGYISFEFAHLSARAGAKVRIIHRGERPLRRFEKDLVGRLVEKTRELGITLHLNTEVTGIEKNGDRVTVYATADGETAHYEADLAVHGAGRVPELDDMDLERGGVARTEDGVTVNAFLQSVSNPRVYAAGDAADTEGLPLTPVAAMESHIVASNLLNGNQRTPSYEAIPTVVFTVPPLASVGFTEAEAQRRGVDFTIQHKDMADWYTYRRVRETHAAFKVLVDNETDRVLGAHLLGQNAGELINLFATAIRFDLTATDLKKMVFAYPTPASDLPYML